MLIIVIFLPGVRDSFPMISLTGNIFILGGDVGGFSSVATSSVLVSSDNGSTWEEAETSLATPRRLHTAVTTETLQCN